MLLVRTGLVRVGLGRTLCRQVLRVASGVSRASLLPVLNLLLSGLAVLGILHVLRRFLVSFGLSGVLGTRMMLVTVLLSFMGLADVVLAVVLTVLVWVLLVENSRVVCFVDWTVTVVLNGVRLVDVVNRVTGVALVRGMSGMCLVDGMRGVSGVRRVLIMVVCRVNGMSALMRLVMGMINVMGDVSDKTFFSM